MGRQNRERRGREEGEKRSAFGSRGMCRCVVKTTKRFDYVTKLATTTAELRAVASLRSTVFREEYDKLITIASAIASPQKGRILATVEWDRLEKATANQNDNENGNGKALLLCVSAWLGGRCDAKVKDTILSEVDRSTLVAQEGCEEPAPVIGSLDLSTKLPKGVARVVDESQSLSAGVSSVAYVSNVGVLSGARCC